MLSTHDIINNITGMTPNLPSLSPFAEAWSSGVLILAQSVPDISGVPADYVKNYLLMSAFVAAVFGVGGIWYGRRGSKDKPLHVHQPLNVDATVTHAPVHAPLSALDELRDRIDSMARENLREHNAHRARLAESIESGQQRQANIITALHDMESRMTAATLEELKSIHERLNPLAEKVAEHSGLINSIKDSLAQLWDMVKPLVTTKRR